MKSFPNVTTYVDRHGRTRHRFRKKGLPQRHFHARYGTQAFQEELRAFLQGEDSPHRRENYRPRTAPKLISPKAAAMFVYIIGGEDGPVKIGISADPISRCRQLQRSNPYPLHVLATAPGGAALEARLHRLFRSERLKGEWFTRSERLEEAIEQMIRGELSGSVRQIGEQR